MSKFILKSSSEQDIYEEELIIEGDGSVYRFYWYNKPPFESNKYELRLSLGSKTFEIILQLLPINHQQQIITFFEEMVLKYA